MNYNVLLLLGLILLLLYQLHQKYTRYRKTEHFVWYVPFQKIFKIILKVSKKVKNIDQKAAAFILQGAIDYLKN